MKSFQWTNKYNNRAKGSIQFGLSICLSLIGASRKRKLIYLLLIVTRLAVCRFCGYTLKRKLITLMGTLMNIIKGSKFSPHRDNCEWKLNTWLTSNNSYEEEGVSSQASITELFFILKSKSTILAKINLLCRVQLILWQPHQRAPIPQILSYPDAALEVQNSQ